MHNAKITGKGSAFTALLLLILKVGQCTVCCILNENVLFQTVLFKFHIDIAAYVMFLSLFTDFKVCYILHLPFLY